MQSVLLEVGTKHASHACHIKSAKWLGHHRSNETVTGHWSYVVFMQTLHWINSVKGLLELDAYL